MRNFVAACALLLSAALALSASEPTPPKVDWDNGDPVQALMLTMRVQGQDSEPAVREKNPPAWDEIPSAKQWAQAVGPDELPVNLNTYTAKEVELVLNDTEDRVGAKFYMRRRIGRPRGGSIHSSRSVLFRFPQLRVNRQTREILIGDDVVASYTTGWFGRVKLSKNYRLGYEVQKRAEDDGFNYRDVSYVKVYLERTEN
ncbi:MAG: hypothetical protein HY611_06335 [Elusimicrobia bacterium]|nr:hypothetical protein [Elusimicrobiota bacterium]